MSLPLQEFDVVAVMICFKLGLSRWRRVVDIVYLFIQPVAKDKLIGER
jgi:hypothetical protein